MVFQLRISCNIEICKESGRHYFDTGTQKKYNMPQPVPEIYRDFARISGDHFKIYTSLVTDETQTSVANFLDKYPDWSELLEADDFTVYVELWTETDHNRFREALQWFNTQKIAYTISWFS
jgi:hypothetical protein